MHSFPPPKINGDCLPAVNGCGCGAVGILGILEENVPSTQMNNEGALWDVCGVL